MVTVKQKSMIYSHTKKELKHNTKDSHQITEENKRRKEKKDLKKQIQKTMKKMAMWAYILIITLNVNELNATTKRQTGWMDTKTGPMYMLPKPGGLQSKGLRTVR